MTTVRLRINPAPPALPKQRRLSDVCLCPGCYYVATEQNELCLRCTLNGCDHEENRHV